MYRVGIIGMGKIAAMYGTPGEEAPYCHAGGILQSRKVALAAVADPSPAAQAGFRERWGRAFPQLRYYDDTARMLQEEKLDVAAVCVRGPHHFEVTRQVIEAGVRAVFLEKPPTCSLAEMDALVAAAAARHVPITVSYSRHWAPHVLRLQSLVQEGLIGEVRTVVGYVGHSFLSFASHATDLICQFAGYCPTAVMARGHMPEGDVPPGYEPEPLLDGMLIEFANGVTGLQVGNDGEHGGFYCDVIGTEGLARVGIYIPPFARKKDGTPIDLRAHGIPANTSVFHVAYDQIADHLDGGPLPHCTDHDFIQVHEIGFGGIESVLTRQRVLVPNAQRQRRIFANG